MAARVVLILGSGPRIGDAVSGKFAAEGYKVAFVSRKGTDSINEQGYLSLQTDLANPDPSLLATVFDKVKSEFKAAPSVVVYNAGFIYADQRQADGKIAGQDVSGPAHADFYTQLAASGAKDVPWHATFVKDKGYVKF
ncbi:putative short chain type protein [Phaeoacremonium minimum UCRPA7]|uniref:Putative short chain type protein n=1 Tax=Phaeoacremonium minimum (strain UCR-PA7) TaxID=1286976 RepID=R8BBM4_PHAM7|nr:putative short chain type protein [Phaeoacremonium minimum UCRPA7]EON96701.1 putative short chain type protein [Phaeoacremonium minimum UCRPA7]